MTASDRVYVLKKTAARPRRRTLSLNDVFLFGKHKGETIKSVIVGEPWYVRWCIDNVEGFKLDNDAYKMYEVFCERP